MTTYPLIGATKDATILPQGAFDLLDGIEENITFTSGDGISQYPVAGAMKPWPGIQDGFILTGGLKGMSPSFKHIDLKAARQPGVTNTGTVYDVMEMDLQLEAHANTPQGLSKAVSEWVSMWDPTQLNKCEYWTPDRGYWYFPARLSKPFPDTLTQMPRTVRMRKFTQTVRCDTAFWYGMPQIDTFQSSSGSGFLQLQNIGDQDGWPVLLVTGPGTFAFANGPGSTSIITFGPLHAGQKVLLTTQPRLRNVIDLTNAPVQPLTAVAQLVESIFNFVTNNNVPPLLQWFESLFGVPAPQGPLYSLLHGRYTNPIPGVRQPQWAQPSFLPVGISGGNSDSKIVGRIDPQRRWPE